MVLDEPTRRNLELTTPLVAGDDAATLLMTLDRTITSPGARRLRVWMERPLVDLEKILNRLDAVDELFNRRRDLCAHCAHGAVGGRGPARAGLERGRAWIALCHPGRCQ